MSNRYGYFPAVIHTIGADGKTLPVTALNPLPTGAGSGLVTVENIDTFPDGSLNASVVNPMGVLPVSQINTLRDGKILGRLKPEMDEIHGTGTGTHQDNKYLMEVTAGQWKIYQSKHFLPYFSGKPQKVELTFDNFSPQTGVIKRVGYFSSSTTTPYDTVFDGFYLESGNDTIKFIIKNAGMTISETDITEFSGYSLLGNYQNLEMWDNFSVIEFNFLWLGGAYIELRVVTSSGFTTVHKFIYAGTSKDVFIKSPNQPVRYEIRSSTGEGSFRYICNQVATSGSIDESAQSRSVNTGVSAITLPSSAVTYPIIAIKKQAALRMNPIRIQACNLFVTSSDRIRWTLQVNPTMSAALTYSNLINSSVAYAIGNGSITVTALGTVVAGDYITQKERIPTTLFQNNYLAWLSGNIDGTQDEYVLCATPITTNTSIHGAIAILEQ